jgi:hypothetical protein
MGRWKSSAFKRYVRIPKVTFWSITLHTSLLYTVKNCISSTQGHVLYFVFSHCIYFNLGVSVLL